MGRADVMRFRSLGDSDIQVSTISLGSWLTYSGGVGSLADVRAVAAAGASGVILGRALLEGLVPLAEAIGRARAAHRPGSSSR